MFLGTKDQAGNQYSEHAIWRTQKAINTLYGIAVIVATTNFLSLGTVNTRQADRVVIFGKARVHLKSQI